MSELRIRRLLRTLWYLKPEQLRGQLARALRRGPVTPRPAPDAAIALAFATPTVPWLGAPAHARPDGRAGLELLSVPVRWPEAGIDWDHDAAGPLWAYHLHQFDWARSPSLAAEDRIALLSDWVRRHRVGIGWDSGPISNRSIAWLKLMTTPGALPDDAAAHASLLRSLASQLETLAANLETHIQANHLLWNLIALVFAGTCLDGEPAKRWRGFEEKLLEQLDEQILPDGAHYERAPMYHALLLENLLDLSNALASVGRPDGDALAGRLRDAAARMLGAHAVWTHPDGEIALFGDSAFDIAQPPERLVRYAAALSVDAQAPAPAGALRDAGIVRLGAGPFTLIATAAAPSPAHQPGHAHCDALSFELSFGEERVVTDTGVAEYLEGPRRSWSRATRAHGTVEVEGHEQSELWAAHRVGGRPDVALHELNPPCSAEGVCAGWATPETLHRRRFEVDERGVTITDAFERAGVIALRHAAVRARARARTRGWPGDAAGRNGATAGDARPAPELVRRGTAGVPALRAGDPAAGARRRRGAGGRDRAPRQPRRLSDRAGRRRRSGGARSGRSASSCFSISGVSSSAKNWCPAAV